MSFVARGERFGPSQQIDVDAPLWERKKINGILEEMTMKYINELFPDGFLQRHLLLGVCSTTYPKIVGLLVYDPDYKDDVDELFLRNTRIDQSALRISKPSWMKGFRSVFWLWKPVCYDELILGRAMKAMVKSLATVVVIYLSDHREFSDYDHLAVIFNESPAIYKRRILSQLCFPLYDPAEEDRMTESPVCFNDIVKAAKKTGVIFYVKKMNLSVEEVLETLNKVHDVNGVTLVIDFNSRNVIDLFKQIIAIDGCSLIPLSEGTPVAHVISSRGGLLLHNRPYYLTRANEEMWLSHELSWTLPFLYGEHHLERTAFINEMAPALQCPLCFPEMGKDHDEFHENILRQMAALMANDIDGIVPAGEGILCHDENTGRIISDSDPAKPQNFHLYSYLPRLVIDDSYLTRSPVSRNSSR